MKSMEVIGGVMLLAGVVVVAIYPNETLSFAYSVIEKIRWIHHDMPSHM